MKKLLCLLIFTALFFTGCFALPVEEDILPPPVAHIPEGRPLRTALVSRTDVVHFANVRAEFMPTRQQTLTFGIAGRQVLGVFVQAGDMVSAGDVVAQLNRPYLFDELDSLRRDEERMRMELAHSRARHENALSNASITGEAADVTGVLDSIRQTQDRLAILERRIEYIQAEIRALYVVAPFDGIVIWALELTDVTWSSVGMEIATISDQTEQIFVVTGPPARAIEIGEEIEITIDDEVFMSRRLDPAARGFANELDAHLLVLSDDISFVTNLTVAMVHVILAYESDALAVPNMAVNTIEGRTFVYVVEDGLITLRYVEVGLVGNNLTVILSGLSEGEVIAL